jgi:hypothetical protein
VTPEHAGAYDVLGGGSKTAKPAWAERLAR